MCLAIPGKIVSINEGMGTEVEGIHPSSLFRMGKVNFGGIIKEVSLAYVPEAKVGDYVIVHVGFAISVLDEQEANRVFEYFSDLSTERGDYAPG
jgi:hydrogenase expression/formation protein HypC